MINNIIKIFFMIIFALFISCTKEIDISEFDDDFKDYNPELRIEAIILSSENTAIVRIDKSVTLNDTKLYDCKDNDGDWDISRDDLGEDGEEGDPTDEDEDGNTTESSKGEGNGKPDCNEPHVDEPDEVITQVHIENCIVKMMRDDLICNFETVQDADTIYYNPYKEIHTIEESGYQAYIPNEACNNQNFFNKDNISTDTPFYFECDCSEDGYGKIISKTPTYIPKEVVIFAEEDLYISDGVLTPGITNSESIEELQTFQTINYEDTLYFSLYPMQDTDEKPIKFIYYSSILPYTHYQLSQYQWDEYNDRYILFHGHYSQATDAQGIINEVAVMKETAIPNFIDDNNDGILDYSINKHYYEISTFSESYKDYYAYDLLDLNDPERTNLRELDQEGNITITPVMGTFGAIASKRIYFEFIECGDYEDKVNCEHEDNTHGVCSWYSPDNIPEQLLNQLQKYLKEEYDIDFDEPMCFSKKLPIY